MQELGNTFESDYNELNGFEFISTKQWVAINISEMQTCDPRTTICGSWIESEPTVLKTSCNLFTTGIKASILYDKIRFH